MRKILLLGLMAALIAFVSCKVFEPNTEEFDFAVDVNVPTTKTLFEVDDFDIYFDGTAPNYIEGYFEFDQAINKSTFESGFELYPIVANQTLGNRITGLTFNWQNDKRVEFRTTVTYDDDVTYFVRIPTTVRSTAGTGISGNHTCFTVGCYTSTDWITSWQPGTYYSYVYAQVPISMEEESVSDSQSDHGNFGNVADTETFIIQGFADLDETTINATNISFEPAVTFTVTKVSDSRYRLSPASSLTADTDYTITVIMDNIRDEYGNAGSDFYPDGNDNDFVVKFDTYVTHANTLMYNTCNWREYQEVMELSFNTPSVDNDYLDHSTINYTTIRSSSQYKYTITVEDSIVDKRTYIVIKGEYIDGYPLTLGYQIADIDGNTLDGNENLRLEGDYRDDKDIWLTD